MKGMLKPVIKEEVQGAGEIRQIFKISKVGTAGGSILATGTFTRKSRVRLIRDGVVIYEGELKSLKRYKDDVSEVQAGQEFGFVLEDFNDLKEGDTFEAFILKEIARESAE
jgi:translation initiation factor IF-2